MNKMHTVGFWKIKPGAEQEFINEWTEFAKWTSLNFPGAKKGYLLQDEKDPYRFISHGAWENEKIIESWRESNEFKIFVSKVMPLLDDFQPNLLKEVATSE